MNIGKVLFIAGIVCIFAFVGVVAGALGVAGLGYSYLNNNPTVADNIADTEIGSRVIEVAWNVRPLQRPMFNVFDAEDLPIEIETVVLEPATVDPANEETSLLQQETETPEAKEATEAARAEAEATAEPEATKEAPALVAEDFPADGSTSERNAWVQANAGCEIFPLPEEVDGYAEDWKGEEPQECTLLEGFLVTVHYAVDGSGNPVSEEDGIVELLMGNGSTVPVWAITQRYLPTYESELGQDVCYVYAGEVRRSIEKGYTLNPSDAIVDECGPPNAIMVGADFEVAEEGDSFEFVASGYPADADPGKQAEWVSERVGVSMNNIGNENDVAAFYVNVKGMPSPVEITCPEWASCGLHLANEFEDKVFFVGHGETAMVWAATIRVGDQYEGENACDHRYGAERNAIEETFVLSVLGYVRNCEPQTIEEPNLAKGAETRMVSSLVGVDVIRVGTEPGAFQFQGKDIGPRDFVCPNGAVCTVHETADSETWTLVVGSGQTLNATDATIRLLQGEDGTEYYTLCQIWQTESVTGTEPGEGIDPSTCE